VNSVPISRDTVVSLKVDLYDAQGVLLQRGERVTYLHGGYDGIFEALEHALEGKHAGDTVQAQLEPDQAFGEYNAELVRIEPVARYGEGVAVGMQVEEDAKIYTVTDCAAGKVVLDANHPLAGMALRFVCEVLAVRSANPEEIRQGVSLR
jgi:FKBP-type peptidyl-prolyl cis-trans isomerase SlyD